MTTLKAAGFSMLVLLAVACGARTKLSNAQPVTADLKVFSKAMFSVSTQGIKDDVVEEKNGLENLGVARLRSLGVFDDVQLAENGSPALDAKTLHIRTTMTKIRKVGGGKRFMLGALAGRSGIECKVELVDASGNVVGVFDVKGESGGSGIAGGTGDAVKKTAEGIATALRAAYKS